MTAGTLTKHERSAAAYDDDPIGALPCGFAWLDAEGHVLGCNALLAQTLGREPSEVVGRPFHEFAFRDDGPRLLEALVESAGGPENPIAIAFESPDGRPRRALVAANPLRGIDGRIASIAVAALAAPDAPAPTPGEGEAAEATLLARRLADHASEMLLVVEPSGRIAEANRAAWERLGYTRAELLGTVITDIDLGNVGSESDEEVYGKRVFRSRLRRRDGSVLMVETRVDVLAEGAHRRVYVAARDIAEEVAARAAAAHSQRELADLVATFDGIAWVADAQTLRFLYVSDQAERLTGYPVSDWLQPGFWAEHVHPEDREGAIAYCLSSATAAAPRRFEYRFMTCDGEPIWIRDTVTVVAEPGQPARLRGMMVDVSEEKHAALRLREAEARFRCLVEDALAGVYMVQRDRFVYANPRLSQIFGFSQQELLSGISVVDLAHPDDRPLVRTQLQRNLAGEIETLRFGFRGLRKDGELIELELLGSCTMLDEEPTVVGTLLDVTEQRRAEDQARLAARTLEASAEGIVITDAHGTIVKVNAAFTEITGYSAAEAIGRTPAMLKSGRQDAAFYRNLWSELTRAGHWSGEIWNRRRCGEVFPEWLSITAVRNEREEVTHYIGIFSDLTQRKHIEATLDRLAHFDPLTGLPNRTLMLDRLAQSMASAKRHDRTIAVLIANLDRLQHINDSLGHRIGDALLKSVAERMQESVRPDDTVCRYGGDEFVIILSDLASSGDAGIVAEKVLARVAEPQHIDGHELATTASLGISVFPADGADPGELLKYADIAMHHAKSEGRGTYQFYRAQMNAQSLERLLMESSLRRALERDEFLLHYQPVVRAGSQEVVALEALIRWRHPDMGMVAPVKFIPLAEETGQIVPIGDWVLREACRCVRGWQAEGHTGLSIAVNLSARQFRKPDLVDTVKRALAESGLDPRSLELELTESMLMHDADRAVAVLSELRQLGVRFSIDDFGTGYSSLSHLKRFPIDKLKIDRSFVKDIPGDANDSAIAQAVIALGHSLGLEVVAEGVETPAQLKFLRQHACDAIQGYLFSPPKDREAISRLLGRPIVAPAD